ncbi:MAG: hypothetical protein U9N35_08280 [Euryarchaeota archaeon]|nr:hypothetical protein [Euryarchaeota archaeon]
MIKIYQKMWAVALLLLLCSLCISEKEETESIVGKPEETNAEPVKTEIPTTTAVKTNEPSENDSFTDITEAKELLGERVAIRGVVTAPPGIFRDDVMYIQDSTAGIKVYSLALKNLDIELGDIVTIDGVIDRYYENIEIKFLKKEKISISGHENPVPLDLSTENAKKMKGSFVRVEGTVTDVQNKKFYIADESGEIAAYIDKDTGINLTIKKEDNVVVMGVISQYKECVEILPRYEDDIRLLKE